MTVHNEFLEVTMGKKIRPFIDTFRELEHGSLLDTLSEEQRNILDAVESTMQQGELVIKIKYKLEKRGQISLECKIDAKLPKMSRGSTMFFLTPDMNLSTDMPGQGKLPLQSIDTEENEVITKVE